MIKIILLYFLLMSSLALAETRYESFDLTPMGEESFDKLAAATDFLDLVALASKETGGIELFGLNQIFVNEAFNQIVAFKYDVQGKVPLDQWMKLSSGSVYHFISEGKINALFVRGLNPVIAEKILNRLKEQTFSMKKLDFSLISRAQADECMRAPLNQSYPAFEKISESLVFQSVLGCATGAKRGAYEATIGSVEQLGVSVWNGMKAVGAKVSSVFTEKGKSLDEYYSGVVHGLKTTKDIFVFAAQMAINPTLAANNLRQIYGVAADKIITLFEGLRELPAPVMVEMGCSIITGVGIDVLVTYLTAGAGSAKLALTMARVANQSKTLSKIYAALGRLYQSGQTAKQLSKEKLQLLTRRLLENKIPEHDLDFIHNLLGLNKKGDQFGLEAVNCYVR